MTAWNVFCTVLGPTVFRLVALIVIIFALVRRNLRVALFLVISVELAGIITEIAKYAANRPRPATALVSAPSTSFPSGHALGVMVGVLALLTVVLPVVRRRAAGLAHRPGRRGRHPDRSRSRRAKRALPIRCRRRMGVRLRVFRRVPADGPAVAARHGNGRNTGSARYRTLNVASVTSVPTSPSCASVVGPSTDLKVNSGTRIS